jgi:hypothetical protein
MINDFAIVYDCLSLAEITVGSVSLASLAGLLAAFIADRVSSSHGR